MSSAATPELSLGDTSQSGLPEKKNVNEVESGIRQKIEVNPADILAYLELVQYYESNDAFAEAREVYKKLHEKFPAYSPLWTLQLKGELQRDEFEFVEKMLAQCLSGELANNDLPLWSTYLDYVRRRNNLITGGQEARAVVVKAFDLVMDKCAVFEPRSSQFWNDYLSFLEQWKPVNKWEEQQRLDMLRKLYKRMLSVPFDNIEKMWNRYTEWEQDVNSLTARKFIGELSSEYMKARSLYQEWSHMTKGLRRSYPVSLSTANKNNVPQAGEGMDPSQLQIWLSWIVWEKENKMSLSHDQLHARITYVYKQGVQCMLFAAEMWYDYAMYIQDVSERQQILYTAVLANSDSPSLTFKLAECYESDNKVDEVKRCFEGCTQVLQHKYQTMTNSRQDDMLIFKQRKKLTFVYCVYMNTMKRLSGLSAARAVFGKCRKLKRILTHDIYIENAYLEFQNQNDYKTACKVLELGLKYFQTDPVYVNKYLDFLILVNRDSQIKTLFETSVEHIQDLGGLKSIYKKMISYESKFGTLQNVYSLEKRFFERFPQENMIEILTDRYKIQDENMIKQLELNYLDDDDSAHDLADLTGSSLKRARDTQDKSYSNKRLKRGSAGVPEEIVNLLAILPKRQYFKVPLLDPQSLINYLNDQVELPSNK
ncbi:BN860_18492g1_1 [Zygosaccharomyces bailii CLIB 213]|uniref:mRNA 3'-end-processing protein RNA14 n=1 Tax=Zygosaccharomyces bailii (strain CLIB 213 / ATCC 58445 / CBS 680 / BCRC 21525 / NBRC 1098 / NCYC 1416 / NRRL Y-2227) TaxID=1333698 RepID=A0A8J2T4D9_ZYGB2|nr:BN860_18492g1_1 [Zygosaccharomyces bailii CLIB 213]